MRRELIRGALGIGTDFIRLSSSNFPKYVTAIKSCNRRQQGRN